MFIYEDDEEEEDASDSQTGVCVFVPLLPSRLVIGFSAGSGSDADGDDLDDNSTMLARKRQKRNCCCFGSACPATAAAEANFFCNNKPICGAICRKCRPLSASDKLMIISKSVEEEGKEKSHVLS